LSSSALPRIESRSEFLYLPSVSSTSSGDARPRQLIFPEKPSCLSSDATCDPGKTIARGPSLNLLEALTIDRAASDKTPTQSIRNLEELDMVSLEEDVDQLIHETNEAFQAVGTALADAKAATQGWRKDPAPESVTRIISVSQGASRREARPPAMAKKSVITRTKSVAKGKRKGISRKKNLLSRVRNVRLHPASTHPRWTLTDVTANVIDIFSGIRFKIEADEMLTPDRLRRLKQEDKVESERRISSESTRSVDTDESTPTEPFNLESLYSRLASVVLKEPVTPRFPSPVLLPPTIPWRRKTPARLAVRAAKAKVTLRDDGMELQDLKLTSPPRVLNRSNVRSTPPLPNILEVSPLHFTPTQPHYGKAKERQFYFESTKSIPPPPDYILLSSTLWTLTCPLFKQGPIRIEQKEKESLPDDQVLDWTAFQMAISGTMDEVGADGRDDIEWAADEAEVDEILDWWAGYKFLGYGRMMQDGTPRGQRRVDAVTIKTHRRIPRSDAGTDKVVVEDTRQGGSLSWVRKGYTESMPPSPMLAFVPPSPSKRDEVIPMGFNLSHDLGDFLEWETNYVRKFLVDD
jgi:hypothetical protein